MFKFAVLLTSAGVLLAVAISGNPAAVAPAGLWRVDAKYSDAQMVTNAMTNYGKNKIMYTVGIARVTGQVNLDKDNPDKSSFDFTMYPASFSEPPMNEEGRAKTAWLAHFANHTLVSFHSKGAYRTPEGKLKTTGYLVVTRVDRNVEVTPSESYSGPVYGPPMVHRVTHPASFLFEIPATTGGSGDAEIVASGSTSVAREDFPQLVKSVLNTYWPPVVQDENCTQPSNIGEDYSGPKCTGTFLDAPGLPEESRLVGEDYPAQPSNFSTVVGERLTISVHLHLRPGSTSSKADAGN